MVGADAGGCSPKLQGLGWTWIVKLGAPASGLLNQKGAGCTARLPQHDAPQPGQPQLRGACWRLSGTASFRRLRPAEKSCLPFAAATSFLQEAAEALAELVQAAALASDLPALLEAQGLLRALREEALRPGARLPLLPQLAPPAPAPAAPKAAPPPPPAAAAQPRQVLTGAGSVVELADAAVQTEGAAPGPAVPAASPAAAKPSPPKTKAAGPPRGFLGPPPKPKQQGPEHQAAAARPEPAGAAAAGPAAAAAAKPAAAAATALAPPKPAAAAAQSAPEPAGPPTGAVDSLARLLVNADPNQGGL